MRPEDWTTPAPPYELFMVPLEMVLSPNDCEMVTFAYQCPRYGHALQMRDDGGRYFDHPKGAAWIYIHELGGRDVRVICDLLLHDLLEDSWLLSLYRLKLNFGEDIALDVRAMTKLPKGKEKTRQYLARVIARGPWAILAKLLDRLHNVRSLGGTSPEKRVRQIKETEENHLPVLLPALRSFGDPWIGFTDKVEHLMNDAIAVHQ